ncbi:nucleoside hydrolase [Gloeophyllum trabeum ATCC 11539]|uniref:Nucleoside hydrolase n=1 Tax=Gloeophyllum trabeum (strain ATCC 11539 / FP-39264 / Madison 617) TaxID=670483 RepID=S7PSL7_GLOTA|nr:nucleoside hydrolase [Gloeophyllum trabeum ATCC 11539]EPQ50816.1 nucleoside hydrolase [Gloeophyllum trabeum ATCC 11539]
MRLALLGSLCASTVASAAAQRRYAILDNDWSSTAFAVFLMALDGGIDVLALTDCTGDTWQHQETLHALATLELGNLSCIPVVPGATWPLLQTPERLQAWESIYGPLVWQGAFAAPNYTAEAQGADPTGGDPNRIVPAAFVEGLPATKPMNTTNAANFMVEMVRKYPGQVSIYAAGPLTNVALAVRMDPDFAENAKELVIMGGYVDVELLQATGSLLMANINSDINLIMDPEAASIALTAPFPNITIAGNVANQVISTQAFLDQVIQVNNSYSNLMYKYYGTEFPFWDETAMALLVDPSINTNSTNVFVAVDTAYGSPSYGNIHVYQKALAPPNTRSVQYVFEVDGGKLQDMIMHAVQYPPQVC